MSDNLKGKKVWLVGAGPMAVDHAKVLKHVGITPTVIGRGQNSAMRFQETTGIEVKTGGIDEYLKSNQPDPETFIVIATGTEALLPTLLKLKDSDFAGILIEKPASISIEELLESKEALKPIQDKVFIAYNRRYYSSVQKALELIEEDGGLQSMHFEFTEWSHKIEPLQKAPGVKENWFYANSTHVVDLAFFIAGSPSDWRAYSKRGTLKWHDKSFFTGSGITEKGVLFSYHSNWESAGRWGIELMTSKRKILLKPIEEVRIVNRGTIQEEVLELSPNAEGGFKPGLLKQLEAFLTKRNQESLSMRDHIQNASRVMKRIVE